MRGFIHLDLTDEDVTAHVVREQSHTRLVIRHRLPVPSSVTIDLPPSVYISVLRPEAPASPNGEATHAD